jgi:hypothetical protein
MSSVSSNHPVNGTSLRKGPAEFFKKTQKLADSAMLGSVAAAVLGRSPDVVIAGVVFYSAATFARKTWEYWESKNPKDLPASIRPTS